MSSEYIIYRTQALWHYVLIQMHIHILTDMMGQNYS